MRVEVVVDEDDLLGVRVHDIGRVFERICIVYRSPGFRDDCLALARERLEYHENVRDAVALVFVVHYLGLAGGAGDADLLNELPVRFVNAYHGEQRVVRPLVNVKHVLHLGYVFGACFGDAPFLVQPRLNFVFFSPRRQRCRL